MKSTISSMPSMTSFVLYAAQCKWNVAIVDMQCIVSFGNHVIFVVQKFFSSH